MPVGVSQVSQLVVMILILINDCYVMSLVDYITHEFRVIPKQLILQFFRCSKILGEAGKQENLQKNVPKILDLKSSSEQIFSEIDVGCP